MKPKRVCKLKPLLCIQAITYVTYLKPFKQKQLACTNPKKVTGSAIKTEISMPAILDRF